MGWHLEWQEEVSEGPDQLAADGPQQRINRQAPGLAQPQRDKKEARESDPWEMGTTGLKEG